MAFLFSMFCYVASVHGNSGRVSSFKLGLIREKTVAPSVISVDDWEDLRRQGSLPFLFFLIRAEKQIINGFTIFDFVIPTYSTNIDLAYRLFYDN